MVGGCGLKEFLKEFRPFAFGCNRCRSFPPKYVGTCGDNGSVSQQQTPVLFLVVLWVDVQHLQLQAQVCPVRGHTVTRHTDMQPSRRCEFVPPSMGWMSVSKIEGCGCKLKPRKNSLPYVPRFVNGTIVLLASAELLVAGFLQAQQFGAALKRDEGTWQRSKYMTARNNRSRVCLGSDAKTPLPGICPPDADGVLSGCFDIPWLRVHGGGSRNELLSRSIKCLESQHSALLCSNPGRLVTSLGKGVYRSVFRCSRRMLHFFHILPGPNILESHAVPLERDSSLRPAPLPPQIHHNLYQVCIASCVALLCGGQVQAGCSQARHFCP